LTVCVRGGECLLGEVVDGEMRHSDFGGIAYDCWQAIPEHFPHVALDAYVVMPNHVHGIVVITESVGAQDGVGAPVRAPVGAQHAAPLQSAETNVRPGSLGAVVRSFKSAVTKQINELRDMPGVAFWQRNYWEHIIRNEVSLNRIREYIESNPARWAEDQLHPEALPNRFNRWQP
jgi:putative transposase